MTMEADIGVMWPQAKEWQQPWETTFFDPMVSLQSSIYSSPFHTVFTFVSVSFSSTGLLVSKGCKLAQSRYSIHIFGRTELARVCRGQMVHTRSLY